MKKGENKSFSSKRGKLSEEKTKTKNTGSQKQTAEKEENQEKEKGQPKKKEKNAEKRNCAKGGDD